MPPADNEAPLADDELDVLFAPLAKAPLVALAISGGIDSLALLDGVDRWRRRRHGPAVLVLTVDHGLRPQSAREAAAVASIAARRGLAGRILIWRGPYPAGGIEAAARDARYRLLTAAAVGAGATHLVTAHQRDDQAETFLMRLSRGAGVFGLAAMRGDIPLGQLRLVRPFLDVPRARLAAMVRVARLTPVEDPMNADPQFLRVRVRQWLPRLATVGLDAERLAAFARRMAEVATAIDASATALMCRSVTPDALAVIHLAPTLFAAAPNDVRLRALTRMLAAIGGDDYPPRRDRLVSLDSAMLAFDGSVGFKRTLAGTVVEGRRGEIMLYREFGRSGLPTLSLEPGFAGRWDHRFGVRVAALAPRGLTLSALGEAGRRSVGTAPPGVPAAAIGVLPAVRRLGRLVAVPALGWSEDGEGTSVWLTPVLAERLKEAQLFPDFSATGERIEATADEA